MTFYRAAGAVMMGVILASSVQAQFVDSQIYYNNGNFGIGTSAPSARLEITGNNPTIYLNGLAERSRLVVNAAAGGSSWVSLTENNTGKWSMGYSGAAGTQGSLLFCQYPDLTGNERMRLLPGGALGIGTTDPKGKLHVQDGRIVVNGVGGYFQAGLDSNDFNLGKVSFHPSHCNFYEQYFAGIAYSNAAGWLSVGGGTALNLLLDSGSGANYGNHIFRKLSWNGTQKVYTEVMRINGDGNVGIGTNSPATKLDINGVVKASDFTMTASTWADFVFDKGYVLPPLDSVEATILKEGHLPGVPSEATLKAKGLSLGDMQRIHMQKIEELTLYAIAQNKKIKALESRQKTLESRLAALEARLGR
ncbi:MAG: hypothetical protein AB7F28_02715 [Candidatus Margulisiibacteriota bacterium]